MYSRRSWGGSVDPYIDVSFVKNLIPADQDPLVSVVVFEWQDRSFVGKQDKNNVDQVGIGGSKKGKRSATLIRHGRLITSVMRGPAMRVSVPTQNSAAS